MNIELGMVNPSTGEFILWDRDSKIFPIRYINFEVIEYPEGTDSSSWFIGYEPYTVVVEKGSLLKTNITISLTSPPIASNVIQSGLLKFRISDTVGYGDLWFPPKGSSQDKIILRFMWFLSAALILRYGKFSGTVDVEYKEISILVKVKPYHALKFDTIPLVNLRPDQLTSIPVTLENLGNYNDTYNFRIVSDNKDIIISNPSSITLAPGEQKDIYLGISVPQSAFDYGTLHSVIIEAFSIYDPNVTIDQKTIYFETRGVYVSEISGIGILFLIIIIIIFIAIYLHKRRLFFEKYCTKPDKPWENQEEKKYLETLNENEYKKIREMMEDEYKSALLWYKYYLQAIIKKKQTEEREKKIKEKEEKIKEKTKKLELKKELKKEKIVEPAKKEIKKEKIVETKIKETPKIQEKIPEEVMKKEEKSLKEIEAEREKRRKEQIIQKIRRDQEQQRKKLAKGDL